MQGPRKEDGYKAFSSQLEMSYVEDMKGWSGRTWLIVGRSQGIFLVHSLGMRVAIVLRKLLPK